MSSFGLGGTNGHVVLEEWPAPPSEVLLLADETSDELRERGLEVRAPEVRAPDDAPVRAVDRGAAPFEADDRDAP